MGVDSVNGQDLAARLAIRGAPALAPQLRTGEASPANPPPERRVAPAANEEKAPRSASSAESNLGLKVTSTRLRVDQDTQRIVAQILDDKGEVVRQIPPEEFLEFSVRFRRLEGLLFNRQG